MQRTNNKGQGEIGFIIMFVFFALIFATLISISFPHHNRHVKTKIEKVKGGRYALKDKKGNWWWYSTQPLRPVPGDIGVEVLDFVPDSYYAQAWVSSSGSVRLPLGGTWARGSAPRPEEVEEEIEASVEIDPEGAPEADTDGGTDADTSSADVGVGDADSSGGGGDSGGGDSGGGDSGGGGDGGE